MKNTKRWIAMLVMLTLLFQAIPFSALAGTGDVITDAELQKALQIAGLKVSNGDSAGDGSASSATGRSTASSESDPVKVETVKGGYHPGMKVDETWDAQMLLEWLNDMLRTKFAAVNSTFTRLDTLLEDLKTEDPITYARLTGSGDNAKYHELSHTYALQAEEAREKARFYKNRLEEYSVAVEQYTDALVNYSDTLFDYEKIRYSEQIKDAMEQIESLREQLLAFDVEEVLIIVTAQAMLSGELEPAFSAWVQEVLDTADDPVTITATAENLSSMGVSTRSSRLAANGSVLDPDQTKDVRIMVIDKTEFAVVTKGLNNKYLEGVTVTVTDLATNKSVTNTTIDPELGTAVFSIKDFSYDYDEEAEVSLTVDGSALGYSSFYIPWLVVKPGSVRTETLKLLTDPEDHSARPEPTETDTEKLEGAALRAAADGQVVPYVYSCTFNDMDIWRTQKVVMTSSLNDSEFDIVLEIENPSGVSFSAPVLHYYTYSTKDDLTAPVEKTMDPSGPEKVTDTRVKYTYRAKWKQILSPDIKENQRPWFTLPWSTTDKLKTDLVPQRSKIDQPVLAGTEPDSPLRKAMGEGLGLNFELPKGIGKVGVNLPFEGYWPKVQTDGFGYVTVTFGSNLVEPDKMNWKSTEKEKYDRGMKQYEHKTSLAKQGQKMKSASKYYKKMASDRKNMRSAKIDIGWFLMLKGKFAEKDPDDGSTGWSGAGMAGMSFTLSLDFTQPFYLVAPFYLNINFSASLGFGIGISFNQLMDKNGKAKNMSFDLGQVTIEVRLALTISLGIGVKGVMSAWVAATGGLNIIFSFVPKQPLHISVYLEFSVSVGFEIFWITYSKVLWKVPEYKLYEKNNASKRTPFLLIATACADEAQETVDQVKNEPDSYPDLAPEAKKVFSQTADMKVGVKVIEHRNKPYIFYLKKNKHGIWKIHKYDSGWGEDYIDGPSRYSDYDVYDFDVMSFDNNHAFIVYTMAMDFEDDGSPSAKGGNIVVGITEFSYGVEDESDYFRWYPDVRNGLSPTCTKPHIESILKKANNRYEIYGTLYGQSSEYDASQYNMFNYDQAEEEWMVYGDCTVPVKKRGYTRVKSYSSIRNGGENLSNPKYKPEKIGNWGCYLPCLSFISLDRDDDSGKAQIVSWDYEMNKQPMIVREVNGMIRPLTYPEINPRIPTVLAEGNIHNMEVLQSWDGKSYVQTAFYTETETVGERSEIRLKSIQVSSMKIKDDNTSYVDIIKTDFDLSIPNADFRVATVGASQYLYWLSAVQGEKETDPATWRINGLYYDAVTNSFSDEIVIAEFTLPDSEWNGKKYPSVPHEITLGGNGTGYISVKPNIGAEAAEGKDVKEDVILPLTLYSFPTNLKTVVTLEGASLMDTTVAQGAFVETDFSLMNRGNMGLGSFDLEVVKMEENKETGVLEEKEKVETLHANLLYPNDSKLEMANREIVAKGEHAIYANKDFEYSPKQHEWNVKQTTLHKGFSSMIPNPYTTTEKIDTNRIVNNILVPGSLGGYAANIKIPADWHGVYDLRLRVKNFSTYTNSTAASMLAKERPELFSSDSGNGLRTANGRSAADELAEYGIVRLDYALDESTGKMVLQNADETYTRLASANATLRAAGESDTIVADAEETIRLYPREVEAPEPVSIQCDVHDIDVSHRVWKDYYGEQMLDITIHNLYNNDQAIRLYASMYVDDAKIPLHVNLPHDSESVSAGKTQTITLPLSSLIDPKGHEKIRMVIKGIGIDNETAEFNNEFEVFLEGVQTTPEPTPTPKPVPVTGDSGNPALWLGLIMLGMLGLIGAGLLIVSRKRRK